MPITLTVTCDTDEELARFLEHIRFGEELEKMLGRKSAKVGTNGESAKIISTRGRKVATRTTKTTLTSKPSKGRYTTAKKTASTSKTRSERKPSLLTPIINDGIQQVSRKGQPFRTKDVIEWVMRQYPDLNKSSVTTGVSNLLNKSGLPSQEIKDSVGRPYRLYKP